MRASALFAAAATVIGLATAIAVPATPTTDSIPSSDTSVVGAVITAASQIYGWQLVGMTTEKLQLATLCQNAAAFEARLGNAGLDGSVVQGIICLEANAFLEPDATFINRFLGQDTATLFAQHLIGSFNETSVNTPNGPMNPLAWLCQYGLSYAGLESYNIDPTTAFDLICKAGNVTVRARTDNEANNSALVTQSYWEQQSWLFGLNLVAAAGSAEDLTTLCTYLKNGTYNQQLASYHLNNTLVTDEVCSFTEPIDTSLALHESLVFNTASFVEVLQHADQNIANYNQWLCYALSYDAMAATALDAQYVIYSVCNN